ncbi:hypothetical protein K438DRAFT_573625 [Mycena galopus ATCC 62051]|nr:hypothetical protein K438DRAFT_573625 [Mycena galopus ATCC 62051]
MTGDGTNHAPALSRVNSCIAVKWRRHPPHRVRSLHHPPRHPRPVSIFSCAVAYGRYLTLSRCAPSSPLSVTGLYSRTRLNHRLRDHHPRVVVIPGRVWRLPRLGPGAAQRRRLHMVVYL